MTTFKYLMYQLSGIFLRLLPHIVAKNVFPLNMLMFRVMNLAVMLFVHVVHLLHQVLSVRHKLTHRI